MKNETETASQLIKLVFKAVGLAMAVATVVLNALGVVGIETQVTLLAIGLACIAISLM